MKYSISLWILFPIMCNNLLNMKKWFVQIINFQIRRKICHYKNNLTFYAWHGRSTGWSSIQAELWFLFIQLEFVSETKTWYITINYIFLMIWKTISITLLDALFSSFRWVVFQSYFWVLKTHLVLNLALFSCKKYSLTHNQIHVISDQS